ncbi:MAG: MarR family winged helix-turn-helix transcriptional regulator [Brevefilum sp.]
MSAQNPITDALRDWVEVSMHRSMRAFIHYARNSALSLSQINTLFRLYHHGPRPVNDLADHLGITMAAVSQLLSPLEETGLIERATDPNDRRVKLIGLTEQGSLRVQESMLARHAWIDDLARLIPQEDQDQIINALALLNAYSQQLTAQSRHHGDAPCEEKTPKD